MSVTSTSTIGAMQALPGPFDVGDVVITDGYYAPVDGGGGAFSFDPVTTTSPVTITSTELLSATVSDATNATPIQITTTGPHSFANGQSVVISGVSGTTAANGTWLISISDRTSKTFTLVDSEGNGTYSGGGTVSSVNITTSARHGLVAGQRVMITRNAVPDINGTYFLVGAISEPVFSIATSISPGTGGIFGDGGRSIPSTAVDGRWLRIDSILDARYYGAKCDGIADDSAAVQAMVDANPGGHYQLPGGAATPVTINMGNTSLRMKASGWVLEGGGTSWGSGQGAYAGTTLQWQAGVTGIIALSTNQGIIRDLNLFGGEPFSGSEGGVPWPDAIMPNFTDEGDNNIFRCEIQYMSRKDNSVTAVVKNSITGDPVHSYVKGTQIKINGVSAYPEMEGLYYITTIGNSNPNAAGFNTFTYKNAGLDVDSFALPKQTGYASPSNTGTSTADGIRAGAGFLRIENVNITAFGRFGINAAGVDPTYTADNQSFRNVTIGNCRGIGLYIRGSDANASDFYQVLAEVNLVGGICDLTFLGNTHVAPSVTSCGCDPSSADGKTFPVRKISCTDNVVTVTTSEEHDLIKGQAAVLSGLADPSFEAPPGSAVFVASATLTSFTYNFTHENGNAGAGGTARLANATELFTVAGTGQSIDGSKGTGFSYWISGSDNHRLLLNGYFEDANGPQKLGNKTISIGGTRSDGSHAAAGFSWPEIQAWYTNICLFDSNLHAVLPDRGTTLTLRGGHFSEWPNQISFLGTDDTRTRWYLRDDPNAANPYFSIARSNFFGKQRLALYTGQTTYDIVSADRRDNIVTITTKTPHAIGYASFVIISGVGPTSFNTAPLGVPVLSATENTFQYARVGVDESGVGGAALSKAINFPGESHLCAEDGGSVVFNFDSGTGGVRFCDGARGDAAAIDSAGKFTLYKGQQTVANGVPAEYATVDRVRESASIGTGSLYAVPASGSQIFRVTYYLKITTAATMSASVTLIIGWNDADDGAALTFVTPSPANATDSTGVVTGTILVDAKSSTDITYATEYASAGATSMFYKLRLRAEAL